MDRLKNYLSVKRFRYSVLFLSGVAVLAAGMLIASSAGPAGHAYANPRIAASGAPAPSHLPILRKPSDLP